MLGVFFALLAFAVGAAGFGDLWRGSRGVSCCWPRGREEEGMWAGGVTYVDLEEEKEREMC